VLLHFFILSEEKEYQAAANDERPFSVAEAPPDPQRRKELFPFLPPSFTFTPESVPAVSGSAPPPFPDIWSWSVLRLGRRAFFLQGIRSKFPGFFSIPSGLVLAVGDFFPPSFSPHGFNSP